MEVFNDRNRSIFHFINYFIYFIIGFIAFVLFCYHVNAQDFTSGTYYYNTNIVTDGLGIPTTYTSNTLSMGTTPLTFSNSSHSNAWVLRSDFYSFNYQFISGHSYRISTVYQIQPYFLSGNYDMRLVGANMRFTNQGNLTANYDGKVTVYNNGNSIDQTVQYTSMTYNECSGNYCNWTNTFYFNSTTNADSIAFTHGGNNIGVANKFMFYYPQNPSQYVPEMLTIGTAWVSIDDLGGGTDLDPLIQLEIESNSKLDSINNNIQQGNSKADDINSKLSSTNTLLSGIQNGIDTFKQMVNLQLGNIKSTLDYILSGMSSLLNKIIKGQEVCNTYYQTRGNNVIYGSPDITRGSLNSDGTINSSNTAFSTTDFIQLKNPGDYKFSYNLGVSSGVGDIYICRYRADKTLYSCSIYSQNSTGSDLTWNFGQYVSYVRYSFFNNNQGSITLLSGDCQSGNQSIFLKIRDFFNSFGNFVHNLFTINTDHIWDQLEQINIIDETPITDLIMMPVDLLQAINVQLSGEEVTLSRGQIVTRQVRRSSGGGCHDYTIPFDFTGGNNTLTFPCINLETYLGHEVISVIDYLLCGFICLALAHMVIGSFEGLSSLEDGFDQLYGWYDYGRAQRQKNSK